MQGKAIADRACQERADMDYGQRLGSVFIKYRKQSFTFSDNVILIDYQWLQGDQK